MRAPLSTFSFFLLLLLSFSVNGVKLNEIHRRILHQPLFPETSPPDIESSPPPPDAPDQPFFPENPSTPDQTQLPPPPPPPASADVNGGLPIPTATITTQPTKPGKKIAIVTSVGVVTLGMLSALAFFLYRRKSKHASDTQKLVNNGRGGDGGGGSRIFHEDPRPPTTSSTFLYMGTVEPSREPVRDSVSGSNNNNNGPVYTSPYRKLNSVKSSDRYRPSPELQPLPPLSKPPQPSDDNNSPSPSSYSDDEEECRDAAFYTPHGSAISSDDGYYTAFPRSGYSIPPHSKRTSPRSRSPEMKHVIIPSIRQKQPPLGRLETDDEQEVPYSKSKPKFSQPPPPPDRAAFQAITQDKPPLISRVSPPPLHTPPPPPPPPPRDFQIRPKLSNTEATKPDELSRKLAFKTPRKAVEEAKSVSAAEGETDPSRPKLKPLHWDKVRASSDRATVWDQLKSSSFRYI